MPVQLKTSKQRDNQPQLRAIEDTSYKVPVADDAVLNFDAHVGGYPPPIAGLSRVLQCAGQSRYLCSPACPPQSHRPARGKERVSEPCNVFTLPGPAASLPSPAPPHAARCPPPSPPRSPSP